MINLISAFVSVLSLSVSCYALCRGGPQGQPGLPGEKGDSGDTGARGPKGETPIVTRSAEPVRSAQRERIAEQEYDPELQIRLTEIRQRLREGSGLIKADPDAQSNQPDWRRRNAR